VSPQIRCDTFSHLLQSLYPHAFFAFAPLPFPTLLCLTNTWGAQMVGYPIHAHPETKTQTQLQHRRRTLRYRANSCLQSMPFPQIPLQRQHLKFFSLSTFLYRPTESIAPLKNARLVIVGFVKLDVGSRFTFVSKLLVRMHALAAVTSRSCCRASSVTTDDKPITQQPYVQCSPCSWLTGGSPRTLLQAFGLATRPVTAHALSRLLGSSNHLNMPACCYVCALANPHR